MVAQLGRHPHEVQTHIVYTLVGEMPQCVETSEMAANSIKESLPSLPDEPHPLNYFPFFRRSIGKPITKLVLAVRCNGQESKYSCQCGRLSSGHCFSLKMDSEAISEHLNFKNVLGKHSPSCCMLSTHLLVT